MTARPANAAAIGIVATAERPNLVRKLTEFKSSTLFAALREPWRFGLHHLGKIGLEKVVHFDLAWPFIWTLASSSSRRCHFTRREAFATLAAAAALFERGTAFSAEPEVPVRLQVSLLDRVIPYDRNFSVRVHGKLNVIVLVDPATPESIRIGTLLQGELSGFSSLGGYPFATTRWSLTTAPALVAECSRLHAGVVYVTPGLREPVAKLAAALVGLRILTVGTMAEHAAEGTVLGAAARSGKPRVLVNLSQARAQAVDFRADFLRMAEVVG